MGDMDKYVLVSFLGEPPAGVFSESDWPLNITIVRAFTTAIGQKGIEDLLDDRYAKQKPVEIVGKSKEKFGAEGDKPVTLLEPSEDLQRLHEDSLNLLRDSIVPLRHSFEFVPHITDQPSSTFEPGQTGTLSSISLVHMKEGAPHVSKTWSFA